MQNGVGVLDASTVSQDHAVAMDPLIVERIEIVRGPAALLYGSSAIGGVVNMVTSRIPEKVPESTKAKAEAKYSSTDHGRSGGASVTTSLDDRWVIHADGSLRGADDYHVPGYARTAEERESEPLDPEKEGRVYNSFNRTATAALGTSYVFDSGYLGTSFSNYGSTYGPVAERSVEIEMEQQHWDVSGELYGEGFFKVLKAKNSFSNYKHEEIEDGEVGTTFKNQGNETRVDVNHESFGSLKGILGLQTSFTDYEVEGDEAFLPNAKNENYSAFLYEELTEGNWRPSLGARFDASKVSSETSSTFGPGTSKSFSGGSFSAGILYQLNEHHSLVLSGAYTERAPTHEELFANGRHVATAQFESGNPDLKKERGHSLEVSWRHQRESSQGSLGAFLQDFHDFIILSPTGTDDGDPEDPFDVYNYQAVNARLYGIEAEYLYKFPSLLPGGVLEVEFKLDTVRGVNRQTKENLPLIPPVRETIAFVYKTDLLDADLEIQRSEKQKKTAPNETPTDGYTLVNAGIDVPMKTSRALWSWNFRVQNIFDTEARNHVSVLKEIAPLPGRSFILGLKVELM